MVTMFTSTRMGQRSDTTTPQDTGVELRSRRVRAKHMNISINPEPRFQNKRGDIEQRLADNVFRNLKDGGFGWIRPEGDGTK